RPHLLFRVHFLRRLCPEAPRSLSQLRRRVSPSPDPSGEALGTLSGLHQAGLQASGVRQELTAGGETPELDGLQQESLPIWIFPGQKKSTSPQNARKHGRRVIVWPLPRSVLGRSKRLSGANPVDTPRGQGIVGSREPAGRQSRRGAGHR